ncbi:hypothetical protein [Halobacteriovorax sp. HLS]|uniref:hypothetical protein n=1 Tax=Halobacteriovorax sp. HLS TaxID=2234000 RepID=UPI000FDC6B9A|nr:hypothetical protein [Halobacteriovorax sp. HLS]
MIKEINNYFRYRKGKFNNFNTFKETGLYEFYGNIFGPLVYTENSSHLFIGVDSNGYFYDETYYPVDGIDRVGVVIPKMFLEMELKPVTPSIEWKSVAEKGYCVLNNIQVDDTLSLQALNEAFIPHGINKELNMSKSIYHAYFATLADYDRPELHRGPDYMKEITRQCVSQIPQGNFHINAHQLQTSDIVKYIYDKDDLESTHGPYSFHMDYFSRLHYMFFIYFAKEKPIEGRELLVGKREDFLDFSKEALDMSPAEQPSIPNPFESVSDDRVSSIDKIQIADSMVILMNTLNPMFVHKVEKLRKKNEIVLLTNYLWSPSWPSID